MSDSHIDAIVLQQRGYSFYVRLAIVVREEHLGVDRLGGFHQLLYCHRVWLVARHKGDVDVVDGLHLWNVLRISSDVDAKPVEGQDIAVVSPNAANKQAKIFFIFILFLDMHDIERISGHFQLNATAFRRQKLLEILQIDVGGSAFIAAVHNLHNHLALLIVDGG